MPLKGAPLWTRINPYHTLAYNQARHQLALQPLRYLDLPLEIKTIVLEHLFGDDCDTVQLIRSKSSKEDATRSATTNHTRPMPRTTALSHITGQTTKLGTIQDAGTNQPPIYKVTVHQPQIYVTPAHLRSSSAGLESALRVKILPAGRHGYLCKICHDQHMQYCTC